MKIPEAPCSDDPLALAKFHGEVVGAIACESEKNNRLQQTVDHVHEEQIGMINGVKKDLNGGLQDIRSEMQDQRDEFYKRYTRVNERLDRRVREGYYREQSERIFNLIDDKSTSYDRLIKEEHEKFDGRIEAVEIFARDNQTKWATARWFAGGIVSFMLFVGQWFITDLRTEQDHYKATIEQLEKQMSALAGSFQDIQRNTPEGNGLD